MKQLNKLINRQHRLEVDSRKRGLKTVAKDVMYLKMLLDNISEYIMPGFDISMNYWRITLKAHKKTTVKDFYNQVDILARILNKEPTKTVNKYDFNAWFWLFNSEISIHITTENTEECEIIEIQEIVTQTKYEATGYCKEVTERKHLQYN